MGLDMYLSKRTYVQNWEHNGEEGHWEFKVTKGGKETAINTERITDIIEQIMYWRKANHIHNWFVQNVQEGVDECQESYVTYFQLEELKNTLKKAIDNWENKIVETELLPTKSGFFFGGTEYDKYYHSENVRTYRALCDILNEPNAKSKNYYYQASW